jgi:creatinine amidohydrolase
MSEYLYEGMTWEELDAAAGENRICIIPVGAVEQHGPHLPVDVDSVLSGEIARGVGKRAPDKVLVLPTESYGYVGHVMDYPGTINIDYAHLIDLCLDICKSLAYHGFKRLLLLNGHGSNGPPLDLVARRCNLETDAECVVAGWWDFLQVDKQFLKGWREGKFPGGCGHACELETSVYWFLRPNGVRADRRKSQYYAMNATGSRFRWVDAWGSGPVKEAYWTSSFCDNGTMGDCEKGTRAKGELAFNEAVSRLCEFVEEWRKCETPIRHDHHAKKPSMPMPWNQHGSVDYPEHGGGRHG